MNAKLRTALVLMMLLSIAIEPVFGRGGGGGGGGRGGGGFHGGGGGFGGGGFGGGGGGGGFHGGGGFSGGGFSGGGYHGGGDRFGGAGAAARPSTFYPSRVGAGENRFGGDGFQYHANDLGRPGAGGAGERGNIGDRANIGDRTNIGNRTNVGDRTNIGNRTGNLDRNNFNGNHWNNNHINHGDWYHGNWHGNWNHGWWNRPYGWGGGWGGWGVGAGWAAASLIPWSWGYWGYSNPYATAPYVIDDTTVDYGQPLASYSATAVPQDQQQGGQTPADQAAASFDTARQQFAGEDYKAALDSVNQAIALTPDDPVLHEFRALVLFATGKYNEAAAGIYAVLSTGPGWDWTTLASLYTNIDLFTRQLRALESYCKSHPDEADAAFLLAYEYMTMGSTDGAITELKQVVKVNPKDTLSAQLLASLTAPADAQAPPAAQPAAPSTPVTAAQLAGDWKFARPDGATIELDLTGDSAYTWTYLHDGKTEKHNGKYSVADNLLVLNTDDSPAMVGQVSDFSNNAFTFKLAGGSPNDPGLKFTK